MKKTNKFFDRGWWKDLTVAIIATTLSIILTFGTASLVDLHKRKENRKMTAMMVLSNVESFVRGMEIQVEDLARKDTISTWLLNIPLDKIAQMDQDMLASYLEEVKQLKVLLHDRTAENIFTNNMDTWENLGNFKFIDNVGETFTGMNWVEDEWHDVMNKSDEAFMQINSHQDDYPGSSLAEKYLRDENVRNYLARINTLRNWMEYNIREFREVNRKSMEYFGITERQVMAFTDTRKTEKDVEEEDDEKVVDFHSTPRPDSLYTMPAVSFR